MDEKPAIISKRDRDQQGQKGQQYRLDPSPMPTSRRRRLFPFRFSRFNQFRTWYVVVLLLAAVLWMSNMYGFVGGHASLSLRLGKDASRLGHQGHQGLGHGGHQEPQHHTTHPAATAGVPVPLEAHIMSKCPDAKDCLHDLILPVMQRAYDKTNFTLSFIGRQVSDGGVECKHGPAECMGNIIELCVAELYPDPKIYLGFTMCLFREYHLIPERSLVEDCALEHGVDFEAINECAARDDGEHGTSLLRQSIQHSADAGVQYSCTVRLNEQIYCIRDDGEWKDCPSGAGVNDLVLAIEKLYQQGL